MFLVSSQIEYDTRHSIDVVRADADAIALGALIAIETW
jgi:hypothetical protein